MKTIGSIKKIAAAAAVLVSIGFAAAPASADFYHGPETARHDVRMGERTNHDRALMWRDVAFRDGRVREHCVSGFHHHHRHEYR